MRVDQNEMMPGG